MRGSCTHDVLDSIRFADDVALVMCVTERETCIVTSNNPRGKYCDQDVWYLLAGFTSAI